MKLELQRVTSGSFGMRGTWMTVEPFSEDTPDGAVRCWIHPFPLGNADAIQSGVQGLHEKSTQFKKGSA
jgi:hypothetical protein